MGERITTDKAREHVTNHAGIDLAKRRAELIADGWDDLSADLFCEALDLAADLIDARAESARLLATLTAVQADYAAALREREALAGEVLRRVEAGEHARAVREANRQGWESGRSGAYSAGSKRHTWGAKNRICTDLLATLTPIVGADRALALADGDADARGAK